MEEGSQPRMQEDAGGGGKQLGSRSLPRGVWPPELWENKWVFSKPLTGVICRVSRRGLRHISA